MKPKHTIQQLKQGILQGNRMMLSKAITLVESANPIHQQQAHQLIDSIILHSGNSIRIGITGVPGVGKSTFIESVGLFALNQGKKVAVLAIDPSSQRNKGSILGDKTRMEELSKSENAFIRPSPSSCYLGGIAASTYESVLLCEAAGYDFILIETVGVGQSETMVADLSDIFLFLTVANTGDELQGIKRGIMEMADLIFINKVDNPTERKVIDAKADLVRALQLIPHQNKNWKTPVILGSALKNEGIEVLWKSINDFINTQKNDTLFEERRKQQRKKRFETLLNYYIKQYIIQSTQGKEWYQKLLQSIENEEISSYSASEKMLAEWKKMD